MKKTAFLLALALAVAAVPAAAEELTYHFGVSDQRTNVTFESETDFEVILGSTNTASGSIVADLEKGTGRVELEVPVATLRTGIDLRDEHLRSAGWLDAEKFPTISFVSTDAEKMDGNRWQVTGNFTMHGVTNKLTVTADVRPIPADAAKKAGLEKGEWVRASVAFTVKLSDYGVEIPEHAAAKVNDEWKVRLSAFASTK